MPFKSYRQERYLFATHPALAKRWAAEYGTTPQPAKRRKLRRRKKP